MKTGISPTSSHLVHVTYKCCVTGANLLYLGEPTELAGRPMDQLNLKELTTFLLIVLTEVLTSSFPCSYKAVMAQGLPTYQHFGKGIQ